MQCPCGKPATVEITEGDGRKSWLCADCDLKAEQSLTLEFQRDLQTLNLVAGTFEAMSGLPPGSVPRIRTPIVNLPQTVSNNSIQVGQMYGSAIQQGSPGAIQNVRSSTRVTREPAAELVTAII